MHNLFASATLAKKPLMNKKLLLILPFFLFLLVLITVHYEDFVVWSGVQRVAAAQDGSHSSRDESERRRSDDRSRSPNYNSFSTRPHCVGAPSFLEENDFQKRLRQLDESSTFSVLVTGAAGFIGYHVLKNISSKKYFQLHVSLFSLLCVRTNVTL